MIKLRHLFWAGLAALSLTPVVARAGGETTNWAQVGPWQVMVDHTLEDGCFAVAQYQSGTVMRIGFDIASREIYFMFGNKGTNTLTEGDSYPVRLLFDDEWYFDGPAVAKRMGEYTFLKVKAHGAFMEAFAKYNNLKVINAGKTKVNVTLAGTYQTIRETLRCQETQNAQRDQQPAPVPTRQAPRQYTM